MNIEMTEYHSNVFVYPLT